MTSHADYLSLDRNITARVNGNGSADGVLARKELALQTLIYDHHPAGVLIVAFVEKAALEQGNPHRIEVVWSYEIVHGQGQLARWRHGSAVHIKEELAIASTKGEKRSGRGSLDSGHAFQVLEQLPV